MKDTNTLVYTIPSKDNFTRIGRCGGSTKGGEKWPPIRLIAVAGVTKHYSNTLFIDGDNEDITSEEFMKRFISFKPDLVISEPIATIIEQEIELLTSLKKEHPLFKVAFIGAFANAEAQSLLAQYPIIDYIIGGEPETALIELFEKPGSIPKGVWQRKGKETVHGGQQDISANLDNIPLPAYDLAKKIYSAPFFKSKTFALLESSRGCPFNCRFCNARAMNGQKVRYKSAERIIEELKLIKKYGFKEFAFNDETFTLDKERVIELMTLMIKEGLNFRWFCSSRVDTIDEEQIALMKKAGCHAILFGVESGNQKILDYYKKGITLEQVEKAFKLCKKYGINSVAHFIFGAPEESKWTIAETVRFVKKINPSFASFNLLTPYPGTELFNDLNQQGLIESNNWNDIDQTCTAVINTKYLTNKELHSEMKKAYRQFYFRAPYMLQRAIQLRSLSDFKLSIKGFLNILKLISK